MPGPEGIPEGKGGIKMPAGGKLPHPVFLVPIAAVSIFQTVGREEGMVEVGVKDIGRAALHFNGAQGLVPTGRCPLDGAVKVDIGHFGQAIGPGALGIHAGKAGAEGHFLRPFREAEQHYAGSLFHSLLKTLGKSGRQVNPASRSPAVHLPVACKFPAGQFQ